LLVELAWSWLRLQPDSALTQWFNRRFAAGGVSAGREPLLYDGEAPVLRLAMFRALAC
jgi:hypothetical protein